MARSSSRATAAAPSVDTASLGRVARLKARMAAFLARRPHRSFRRTRRRDYVRNLALPGYWAFTLSVSRQLWQYKKLFLLLALTYAAIAAIAVGIASQDSFSALGTAVDEIGTSMFSGDWNSFGRAGLLALGTLGGMINPTLSEAQQVYAGILVLFIWLTTIWLLRQLMAGAKVRLRDGLYNAGAPIFPTLLIALVLVVQLMPIALAALGYAAAQSSGLLQGGVEAMLFWAAAAGLGTLSLYWLSTTVLALVIVTLPGMYPLRALSLAGDMVVGRRLRLLYRILWMMLIVLMYWIVVLLPSILLDMGIKQLWPMLDWVPLVPVVILWLSATTLVWSSSYIYLLYRKMVDNDTNA